MPNKVWHRFPPLYFVQIIANTLYNNRFNKQKKYFHERVYVKYKSGLNLINATCLKAF